MSYSGVSRPPHTHYYSAPLIIYSSTEKSIAALKEQARIAKQTYEQAVQTRSQCQKQVNDLLQRKSTWSESDVSLFTSLIHQDHLNTTLESTSKQRLDSLDLEVEKEFNDLMRAILNRYHEEQIWSDKIRSASTYGSLAALGLNLFVFVLAIVVVEPWKRKRLGETFEKRIVLMEKENQELMREGMRTLSEHFEKQEEILSKLAAISLSPPAPIVDHESPPLPPSDDTPPEETPRSLPLLPRIVAGTIASFMMMYIFNR